VGPIFGSDRDKWALFSKAFSIHQDPHHSFEPIQVFIYNFPSLGSKPLGSGGMEPTPGRMFDKYGSIAFLALS